MSKKNRAGSSQNDLLENPEALADQLSKTEEFLENNKELVFTVMGLIILVVGGYFGFDYYKNSQDEKAQSEMFQAIYYFESDSLDLALNGDGINLGFLDIIDEYPITDAANLANYYVGTAFLEKGEFESALSHLEEFNAGDLLVQARAYSLAGDAYMELEDYDNAASYYEKAATYNENKFFSPRYWMKAALAFEYANDIDAAKAAYDKVIDQYWDATEVTDAKKYKARLDS